MGWGCSDLASHWKRVLGSESCGEALLVVSQNIQKVGLVFPPPSFKEIHAFVQHHGGLGMKVHKCTAAVLSAPLSGLR